MFFQLGVLGFSEEMFHKLSDTLWRMSSFCLFSQNTMIKFQYTDIQFKSDQKMVKIGVLLKALSQATPSFPFYFDLFCIEIMINIFNHSQNNYRYMSNAMDYRDKYSTTNISKTSRQPYLINERTLGQTWTTYSTFWTPLMFWSKPGPTTFCLSYFKSFTFHHHGTKQ